MTQSNPKSEANTPTKCAKCSAKFKIRFEQIGHEIKCPSCKARITLAAGVCFETPNQNQSAPPPTTPENKPEMWLVRRQRTYGDLLFAPWKGPFTAQDVIEKINKNEFQREYVCKKEGSKTEHVLYDIFKAAFDSIDHYKTVEPQVQSNESDVLESDPLAGLLDRHFQQLINRQNILINKTDETNRILGWLNAWMVFLFVAAVIVAWTMLGSIEFKIQLPDRRF